MDKTLIAYPPHHSVTIRDVLVQLCGGNVCAAALLDFFDGKGVGAHRLTDEQLVSGVLLYRRDSIRAALAYLEARGFLSIGRSPNRLDRTRTFAVNFDALNKSLTRLKRARA